MSLGGAFRVVVAELAAVGLDPAAVCRDAGLDPTLLDDPTRRFGTRDLARVLDRAEALTADPQLGLHMAENAQGRGLLAYVFRAQRTVGRGLDEMARLAATVWGADDAVRIERRGDDVVLSFHPDDALPRHALEFLVARIAFGLRRHGAPPHEIWLRHAAAAPVREYARILGARVRFRRPSTALLLDAALLDTPIPTANPEAAAALIAGLGRRTVPPPQPASTTARLARVVEATLASGERVSREAAARRLGMSGRTLARRLADERSSFRDVVESARRELAHRLVTRERLALGEVASRVGFADQAAFGKAFRRWFGRSATALRAAAR